MYLFLSSVRKVCCLFLLFPVCLYAQTQRTKPATTETYFRYVLGALAHDSMKGRLPGTSEETKAACFIAEEFKQAGCKFIQKNKYYPFDYRGPDSATVIHSAGNVIARINTKSAYSIVVTAHYDHIGFGQFHSKAPFNKTIHNGADDNASGVAMMLALAGWCNAHKKELKYDMVFIAFSGEEDGLHGSVNFLKSTVIDTSTILCNLNFDMLGRLDLMRPIMRIDGALEYTAWDSCLPSDSAKGLNVFRRKNIINDGADHC
ncbi:MAG: M28 family peptidase, partial [Bacteroidia bacterium]